MRESHIRRKTGETDITLTLNLDGTGKHDIQTGVGFFDHMLTGFARHGSFDLTVTCSGDTWVDDHHTVEDVGICLGDAFAQALGEMRGVERFGHILLPMDESLVLAAVDLSGRGMLCWDVLAGENSHHLIEGTFKAAARSLKQAVALTGGDAIPSTKGMLV